MKCRTQKFLFVAVCLLASTLLGQVLKGSISGTVIDPQGAVVPAAQVKATNTDIGSVKLSVGQASTTVEVSAEAPLIEATQSQVTNTIAGTALHTFAGIQENE